MGVIKMAKEKTPTDQIDEMLEHIEIDNEKIDGKKHLSFGICKASDIDDEERTVVAIISTGSIDRDSEVLSPKGVITDAFEDNPVVPWSHQTFDPPIGKALWLKKGRKQIKAKVKFAMTDRAEEVWQLFKGGFLHAFSVGFRPLAGHRPTPEDIKADPNLADARFIFDKWELLEFSPVTVPANAEALATAIKSKNISLSDDMIEELHIEPEKAVEVDETEETIFIPVKNLTPEPRKIEVVEIIEVDRI
jgi:HK97 family phage prohead protease